MPPFAWTELRARFHVPPNTVYLDGNSLGLLSDVAERAILEVLGQWKTRAVSGWSEGWLDLAERAGALLAPLLGASPREVCVCNQTTVNLHQLLATFYEPSPGREGILCDDLAFPSDSYAFGSHVALHGLSPSAVVRVRARADGLLHDDDLLAAMDAPVGLVVFPAVVYTTGQLLDLRRLTDAAHARGLTIGFDCSHSVGAVPHALHDIGADFAFGCSYKYLSAGPGATGWLFVHERHLHRRPGLAGWFGSERSVMFDMTPDLTPAPSATRFSIGTPPLLALAPLIATLGLYHDVGPARLRERSVELTSLLIDLADRHLAPLGFTVATPREPHRRGGHVALRHPAAKSLCARLVAAGVVPDFRNPDIIRLAPVALYNNEADCHHAVSTLARLASQP